MTKINEMKDFKPELLDLVMKDPEYVLYYGESALKTPGGADVSHINERLMQYLLVELSMMNETGISGLNSYRNFSIQKDLIEKNNDPILCNIDGIMKHDFFIRMKISGQKESKAFGIDNMIDFFIQNTHIINLVFLGVSSVQKAIKKFFIKDGSSEYVSIEDLPEYVKQTYIELSVEKRAVVNSLCVFHDSGIMLPLLLLSRTITASEYANALLAIQLNIIQNKNERPAYNVITRKMIVNDITYPSWDNAEESFNIVREQALQSLEYLSYFSASDKRLSGLDELINRGESYNLEFKSTLRWNVKAGRKDPAIEHASLKTISAFLNSSGGILLIGVEDDGNILGTGSDQFENEDRYLLHIWNLIKSSMGQDVSPFINVSLEPYLSKQVCKVVCSRSSRPVFLRQKGYGEEFYIRIGPSSANLEISEALKYIADRFVKQD